MSRKVSVPALSVISHPGRGLQNILRGMKKMTIVPKVEWRAEGQQTPKTPKYEWAYIQQRKPNILCAFRHMKSKNKKK